MSKTYLGDAVYAEWDGAHVVLTTDYGEGPEQKIFLDPGVIMALLMFFRELGVKV